MKPIDNNFIIATGSKFCFLSNGKRRGEVHVETEEGRRLGRARWEERA
jgi:hypothetical protein